MDFEGHQICPLYFLHLKCNMWPSEDYFNCQVVIVWHYVCVAYLLTVLGLVIETVSHWANCGHLSRSIAYEWYSSQLLVLENCRWSPWKYSELIFDTGVGPCLQELVYKFTSVLHQECWQCRWHSWIFMSHLWGSDRASAKQLGKIHSISN